MDSPTLSISSALIPLAAIAAMGRLDIVAKLYWMELGLYSFGAYLLIRDFGIIGAAAAWSLRTIVDAAVMIWLSKRIANVSYKFLHKGWGLVGVVALVPPMIIAAFYEDFWPLLIGLIPASMVLYGSLVWKWFVEPAERVWIIDRFRTLSKFAR